MFVPFSREILRIAWLVLPMVWCVRAFPLGSINGLQKQNANGRSVPQKQILPPRSESCVRMRQDSSRPDQTRRTTYDPPPKPESLLNYLPRPVSAGNPGEMDAHRIGEGVIHAATPGGSPGGGRGFSPAGDPRTCRSSKSRRTSRSSRPSGPHEQARTACSGSSRHDASHPNN